MPHKPGHGTQRKRIERQARGRTAIPVSKSTTQASQQALKDAEDRRLDRLVTQNQDLKNLPSTTEQIIGDMPDKFKDRFTNPDGSTKTYSQMNEADKTIFNFYDDGRNQYQRMINNFIQSSPESARAYATRFPIANLIQKFTPALVGAAVGVPLGLGTLYDEGRRLGSAAIGGLKDIAEKKGIRFPNLFSNQNQELSRAENEQNMLDNTLATLNRQSEISATPEDVDIFASPQTDIAMAPDLSAVSGPAFERIFALPGDNLGKFTSRSLTDPTKASVTRGNYLVSDPGGFLRMATLPTGMAQGGIASLQDPNYNLLMEASDFSL